MISTTRYLETTRVPQLKEDHKYRRVPVLNQHNVIQACTFHRKRKTHAAVAARVSKGFATVTDEIIAKKTIIKTVMTTSF